MPLLAGAMAFLLQAALGWRVGADLHTFFGSVLIATLITSPMSAAARSFIEAALLLTAVPFGASAAWLLPASREALNVSAFLQCLALLLAWTICVAGISRWMTRWLNEPTLGSAATAFLGLAWLGAPIWLGTHAASIVKFHPFFAMNVPLIDLGLWTEQRFEYRYLFSLGQDVPYLLPSSIAPSTTLHLIMGLSAFATEFVAGGYAFTSVHHDREQLDIS